MASFTDPDRKLALTIGINNYRNQFKLNYCINDVEDIAKMLESIKFDVIKGINCDKNEFHYLIRKFVTKIKPGDLVLFYFAGHGNQFENKNYLLPSDYNYNHSINEREYIEKNSINVQYILHEITARQPNCTIMILDCCRIYVKNPAMNSQLDGLAGIKGPPESVIAFSCGLNQGGIDDTQNGRNGIFTEHLLKYLTMPYQDIETILQMVGRNVKSSGFPIPWRASSLTRKIYLMGENSEDFSIQTLPTFCDEFKTVAKTFLDGWPNPLNSSVQVETIFKINNPLLESRYQQFVNSNALLSATECTGWHGTSASCNNGSCMSSHCNLCLIARNGFINEYARTNTSSYACWGAATYFSTNSFVCHTYNGGSQLNDTTLKRCTIMTTVNLGKTMDATTLPSAWEAVRVDSMVTQQNYDTLTLSRNYYIAPANYILLYNKLAATPRYIIVYSFRPRNLQIRQSNGKYCSFHKEYHITNDQCDGHYDGLCLDCADSNRIRHA